MSLTKNKQNKKSDTSSLIMNTFFYSVNKIDTLYNGVCYCKGDNVNSSIRNTLSPNINTSSKMLFSSKIKNTRGGGIKFGSNNQNINSLGYIEGMPMGSGASPSNTF